MSRTLIPVTRISRFVLQAEPTPVNGDVTNGHYLANDGTVLLKVDSVTGSQQTASVLLSPVDGTQVVTPLPLVIPANSTNAPVGPFPVETYGPVLQINASHAGLRFRAYSYA